MAKAIDLTEKPRSKYLITDGCGRRYHTNDYAVAKAKFDENHMLHLYELDALGHYEQIG